VARRNGAVLYTDVWDNKPPAVYWTSALGFLIGGDSYGGVIFLCALATVVALIAFFVISASVYFRGAAGVATILASFYITHGFFQGGTNRTETFLMAFELVAVALYVRGCARDVWWKWHLAGVCCGCAALYKQVGLAAWGTLGLHTIILVILRDLSWRVGLKRCLLLLGGMLIPVVAAAAVIVAQGSGEHAWFAIVDFNAGYFTAGNSSWTNLELNDYMLRQHMTMALLLPVLMCAAALIHSSLWALRPKDRPPEIERQIRAFKPACPRYMLLFFIWYAVAYYGAAVSPHYFEHYLLPTFPPMMLIAGYMINFLRGEIHLTKRLQQRIWVTGCFVAMGYFAVEGLRWHYESLSRVWVFRYLEGRQAEWEAVGDAAVALTGPDDRIQCMGYLPGVYLHARRPNATRFTTTEKLGQVAGTYEADKIRRQFKEQLEADPPALMIMTANDYYMINESEPFSREQPEEYPDWLSAWLNGFLKEHYRFVLEVVDFNVLIFERNDHVPPGS